MPAASSIPSTVSTGWLAERLDQGGLKVLDASWYLPQTGRDARAEYLAGHIPGAAWFDLDAASDPTTSLPHMLPAAEVEALVASGAAQLLDARSRGRFEGSEPEPRPGLRGGHIPGSRNLPCAELVDGNGRLLPLERLRARFRQAGFDGQRPVITLCGSGVTACALVLGLDALGVKDVAVYDGSWTEWGAGDTTPVATGPADEEAA
jgi:3-mercaptopyruvate sulfurtransferase SseA